MVHFGLFPPLVTCASAAYVQWQHCDDHTPGLPAFIPESLSASLVPVDDTHDRLSLRIGRWLEESECARWAAEIMSVNIDFDMLGHSSSHHHKVNATCQRLALESNLFILSLTATEDTDAFYALSTFHTAIHLVGPNAEEKGCLQANITPAFSPAIQATLRYAPLTILVFVLLVGIARSVSDSSTSTEAWARAVLPGFADCLQYLQSIFLTGSLSLFYPGFYQPVVSRLGWVSLFADGSITHSRTYAGINDGIYELNGTYGGTFGLELMTQIVGAPMTMDTWLNMVILIMAIAALAALCLEIYWLMNRPVGADTGLRRTFNRTLHMILSYFMLPLIALSFYQIDNASYLPSYHIFLAALLLAIILIAFVWLLSQIPTRSLGVLIFDSRRRYNQIITSETSDGQHKSFVLALFVLLFIRGAAIGGLQISGQAQLAVLGACELVLLACIVQFQAYNMLSTGTISAVARLGSLICMIMLIPGVASDTTRSAIGYLILLIHGCVLVFGFLVPAMIQLGKLCSHWWNRPTPRVDAYGLRQLRRRQALRTDLPDRPRIPCQLDNNSDAHLNSSSVSSRGYYRPPRSSRISSQHSMDHRNGNGLARLTTTSVTSPYLESSNSSPSVDSGSTEHLESPCAAGSSDSTRANSSPPNLLTNVTDTRSLHPRWADYSFRESDLFYGIPRPASSGRTSIETPESPAPSGSRSLSPLNLWAWVSGQSSTTERGFSVVRPAPPPNLPLS